MKALVHGLLLFFNLFLIDIAIVALIDPQSLMTTKIIMSGVLSANIVVGLVNIKGVFS